MFSAALRLSLIALLVAITPMVASAKSAPGSRIEARLTSTAAARAASGKAKFEQAGTRTKFSTEGEDLPAAFNGKVATVSVNGVVIGNARVALRRFDLNRDSSLRQAVPSIKVGDRVSVSIGGVNVLNGKF